MLNKSFLLLMACMLVFAVACGNDDTTGGADGDRIMAPTNAATDLPQGHPTVGGDGASSAPTDHGSVGSGAKEVRVSDEVRATWKVVEVELTDTDSAVKKVLKLDVGKKVAIEGTNFKISAVVFIPHYVIYEDHIGSKTNELNNPAVLMELFDGDKSVARGWIFKSFTTFNSFVHEKYTIALLEQKG